MKDKTIFVKYLYQNQLWLILFCVHFETNCKENYNFKGITLKLSRKIVYV